MDDAEVATVRTAFRSFGIPMDLTYVGKAFDGMLRTLAEEGVTGRNVLFLHTGGTPLFFDDLESIEG